MKKDKMVFIVAAMILMFVSLPAEASELEAGKAFFEKKRCIMCHTIEGNGGTIASDLSEIGSNRDRVWLLKFFKNPKKLMPTAKMMPVKGSEKELEALADYLLTQK